MPDSGGLSLPGLTLTAGGLVLCYAAINDPPGGPVGVLRSVLQGKLPAAGPQTVTAAANLGSSLGGAVVGGVAAGAQVLAGSRGKIIATAETYLGVPYRLGGASKKGIDCSGLVMRAYEAVGVKLPHKASLQAAKGRRIDRSQVKPGDLVAWGAPGNYPHIALAVSADKVIVAPHTGTVVQYQKLWEKKVPGFGYPTIIRILKD